MKKKKAVHGFTLIELIIVMALFSLIMYSVVSLLDPVTKFFVRSSNFQDTTACVDNMKAAVEGNLKYADRVRVYSGFAPYTYETQTGTLSNGNSYNYKVPENGYYLASSQLQSQVRDFYDEFFNRREFLDCAGKIYVLVFDNTDIVSNEDLKNFDTFSEYTENSYNRGKIVQFEFDFSNFNEDGTYKEFPTPGSDISAYAQIFKDFNESCKGIPWVVNQKLYGNYDYKFTMGKSEEFGTTATTPGTSSTAFAFPFFNNALRAFAADTTSDTTTDATIPIVNFDPKDCTIEISMDELVKNSDTRMLERQPASTKYYASFSMKNVLDSSKQYLYSAGDYMIKGDGTNKYVMDNDNFIPRYEPCVEYDGPPENKFDGFYFIFTNPDAIENNVDDDYIESVQSAYPPAITEPDDTP